MFTSLKLVYYNDLVEVLYNYWVVRKVRADFEGKLKRRRFNFSIHLLNLNLLRHELFG